MVEGSRGREGWRMAGRHGAMRGEGEGSGGDWRLFEMLGKMGGMRGKWSGNEGLGEGRLKGGGPNVTVP